MPRRWRRRWRRSARPLSRARPVRWSNGKRTWIGQRAWWKAFRAGSRVWLDRGWCSCSFSALRFPRMKGSRNLDKCELYANENDCYLICVDREDAFSIYATLLDAQWMKREAAPVYARKDWGREGVVRLRRAPSSAGQDGLRRFSTSAVATFSVTVHVVPIAR